MRVYTIFLIVFFCVLYQAHAKIYNSNQVKSLFSSFSKKFKKSYTGATLAKKLAVFEENIEFIANYNAKNKKGQLEVNGFAALTLKEFEQRYLGDAPVLGAVPKKNAYRSIVRSNGNNTLPESVDWTSVMTPIQHQGDCGSCWAFASTAVFEGHNAIRTKKVVKYSEQYVLDCATSNPTFNKTSSGHILGCSGATCFNVYDFLAKNGGLCTDAEYGPYKEKQGECKTCTKSGLIGDWMSGEDEDQIKAEVVKGPVYGRLNGSSLKLMFLGSKDGAWYEEESCIGKTPNHAVVIVGYGTDPALGDYWLIRNSWGLNWGKDGYFRLKRGVKMCGINQYPGFFKPATEDPAATN